MLRHRVLSILRRRGLSQGELAHIAGVSPQLISYWLRAKTPSTTAVATIASALKVQPEELLAWRTMPTSPRKIKPNGLRRVEGFWNPKAELMPRRELLELKLNKLKRYIEWVYENSSLYRQKFDEVGLKPRHIVTLKDIEHIPYLTRKELMESQGQSPLFGGVVTGPAELALRYHHTSGSSGRTPLRILDSIKDWDWVSELWCYGMYGFGLRKSDRLYAAFGYGNFIGFWGAHYASEKIGAMTIPSGGLTSEARVKQILELGATALIATPTYAHRLSQVAADIGVDLARDSQMKYLILSGEPGASLPATKKALEAAWGAKVGDFPGMSETGGSTCYECADQSGGLHIVEDHYIQEVVDPATGKVLDYGEMGELVVTSFGRAIMPTIRYRTGDLVKRVEHTFCTCGRTFDLYEGGILGRADDTKIIRGVNVFPAAVENIVRDYPQVDEFQIVVYKGPDGHDEIKVLLEPKTDVAESEHGKLAARVAKDLSTAHGGLRFGMEIAAPGALPRFELKAKRLRDLRAVGPTV